MKNSIIKKVKGISNIEAITKGVSNKINTNEDIEALARERIKTCIGCEFYKKEPCKIFRITDEEIKEASNMYCEDCGCALSLKIRQNKEVCSKWTT